MWYSVSQNREDVFGSFLIPALQFKEKNHYFAQRKQIMIYTITLNPALDRTLWVKRVRDDVSNRIIVGEEFRGRQEH